MLEHDWQSQTVHGVVRVRVGPSAPSLISAICFRIKIGARSFPPFMNTRFSVCALTTPAAGAGGGGCGGGGATSSVVVNSFRSSVSV
jgi:hypothetical protein